MRRAYRPIGPVLFSVQRVTLVAFLLLTVGSATQAQVVQTAVGGISIDAEGVLNNAQPDALGALSQLRRQSLEQIPRDLNAAVEMRKVSLSRLADALQESARSKKPISDAMKYLAGLQRIQYVFVYPDRKDIVLVGPGEGWKVDAKGNVVGTTTGRPVMLLDDLLVALRTAQAAANGGITCSIDPSAEGLARMNQQLPALTRGGDPRAVAEGIETALGLQQIRVQGVPETSHFARVLVAADYRMKRIAMNFDSSPVRGLTSYLQMVRPAARMVLSPRFWLEPKYDAVLRDNDGLAFELRGSGVKAMTEEDFIAATGNVQHTGKAGLAAQKWADMMTEKYAELAVADPIFGQLQNCMELAVVGALIVKERLTEKAGASMAVLTQSAEDDTEAFPAPKQVNSQASVLKKGRNWIISASGGVAINSWGIADQVKPSDTITAARQTAAAVADASWYWN
jgi:hypothetical protein